MEDMIKRQVKKVKLNMKKRADDEQREKLNIENDRKRMRHIRDVLSTQPEEKIPMVWMPDSCHAKKFDKTLEKICEVDFTKEDLDVMIDLSTCEEKLGVVEIYFNVVNEMFGPSDPQPLDSISSNYELKLWNKVLARAFRYVRNILD